MVDINKRLTELLEDFEVKTDDWRIKEAHRLYERLSDDTDPIDYVEIVVADEPRGDRFFKFHDTTTNHITGKNEFLKVMMAICLVEFERQKDESTNVLNIFNNKTNTESE